MQFLQLSLKVMLLASSFLALNAGVKFSGLGGSLDLSDTSASLNLTTNMNNFNGTLKIHSAAGAGDNLMGTNNINFNGGILQLAGNRAYLNGSYVPGATTVADTITLNNGDYIIAYTGQSIAQNINLPASTTATITGSVLYANIALTNATSILNLGLSDKFSSSLTLNNGTINLINDLTLGDDTIISGPGVVDMNLYTLYIGDCDNAHPWAGNITFHKAQGISLNGNLTLNGVWTFENSGGVTESVLNGNGNIMTVGGTIYVAAGHTLNIVDVHLKNLGDGHGAFSLESDSTVVLSNVTLELVSNYTHDLGTIKVTGDNCRLISGGNKTFIVDGTLGTSVLNIDNVALYYEPLGGPNTNPFVVDPINPGLITFSNGGVIRSALSNEQPADIIFDTSVATATALNQTHYYKDAGNNTFYLKHSLNLNSSSKLVFVGGGTYTLYGNGFTINLDASVNELIRVQDSGTNVTIAGAVLNNFRPKHVVCDSGCTLSYGSGAILRTNGLNITPTDWPVSGGQITFAGNGTVDCGGGQISFPRAGLLTQAENRTLTIQNARLLLNDYTTATGGNDYGFSCSNPAAMISLDNCSIFMRQAGGSGSTAEQRAGLVFSSGNMTFNRNCKIDGEVSANGKAIFEWSSNGTMQIFENVELDAGIEFRYNPNLTIQTTDTVTQQKSKVKFFAPASTMICNGCDLYSVGKAWQFKTGNLIINNGVNLIADPADANAVEFTDNFTVNILASSQLTVDGVVKYVP